MGMAYVCDTIRTRDLLVRSQTLYPAELHTHLLMLRILANVSPRRVMLPYRVDRVKTIMFFLQENYVFSSRELFSIYLHKLPKISTAIFR